MFHVSYGCDFCDYSTCYPFRLVIDNKEKIACPWCWEELKEKYSIVKTFKKDGVKIYELKQEENHHEP